LVYLTVFAPGGMPYFNKKFNLNSYTRNKVTLK